MRVRLRTTDVVRLLILCGLIAELVAAPFALAGPRTAFAAQAAAVRPSMSRSPAAVPVTVTTTAPTATATLSTVVSAATGITSGTASALPTLTGTGDVTATATTLTGTGGATATAITSATSATTAVLALPVATAAVSDAVTVTVPPTATSTPITTNTETALTGTVATLNSVADVTPTADALARLPLAFEPNQGQTNASVQFLSHGPGFSLYLTAAGATLAVARSRAPGRHRPGHGLARDDALTGITGTVPISATAIRLRYEGGNPNAQAGGEDPLPGVANYLAGSDPSHWQTGIPTYARVSYRDVYPGVDLVYYGTAGRLEYDWRLAAGADPGRITLAVDGARDVRLDADGNLALGTVLGDIVQQTPRAYQDIDGARQAVTVRYTLVGPHSVGFALGAYDTSKPLVIDPVLNYSTYLGGSGNDAGYGVAVDPAGNAYVTGNTTSTNFPVVGAAQGTNHGGVFGSLDAFVSKLNAAGTALVYSTYLGGSGDDYGNGIAVDQSGNAYVTGQTTSTDFPTTANAYQTANHGNNDAFVSKLNAAGNALAYSTYLGGAYDDFGNGIAVDQSGNAYVTGYAASTDFPTTAGSLQPALNGYYNNAFVVKINTAAAGSASLVYGTYLGGTGASGDAGQAIAIDAAGDAYVTGYTTSGDFPTRNALQSAFGGTYDAFLSKVNPSGSALVYSTYLGGSGDDEGEGIAVDAAGAAYVAGLTASTNFPTTANALQKTFGGTYDAFVTKVNPSGGAFVYSTYLGGSSDDEGHGIAVDRSGQAFVTGFTASSNFPTANPTQRTFAGGGNCGMTYCGDAFIAALNEGGTALRYGSYLGGGGDDHGEAIAVDGAGRAYVAGYTYSTNFPTTAGASGTASAGGSDVFVARVLVPAGGDLPWHPHRSVRMSAGLDASVDLADGHVDVHAADLSIPARGPDLALAHTWDSALAAAGVSAAAGQGWQTSLTPRLGGAPGATATYTDTTGAVWSFAPTGSANGLYSYTTPPGRPWQLTASTAGYTLTNILTSEVMRFDNGGRLTADADAYGNQTTMSYGAGSASSPSGEANSGGRALAFTYANGLLADAQSPLWQSGGAGAAGSQRVAYGYSGSQLTSLTRGAGTGDALTTTFGYSGTQLVTVTTPYTGAPQPQAWAMAYDAVGRVSSITSPSRGQAGQAGYTSAYTTRFTYNPGRTQVVEGYGTSGVLTHTYTLNGQGEATATADGLGNTTTNTYDADHDVMSSTDANGNTTTNTYQYVGPNGSTGLVTQTVAPPIQAYTPLNGALASPTTTYRYDPATYDLLETDKPEGGVTLAGYDGHHSVVTTTELLAATPGQICPQAVMVNATSGCAYTYTWRAHVDRYDLYGERTASIDGRGLDVATTQGAAGTAGASPPAVTPNSVAGQYTRTYGYDAQGDQTTESTPPITTSLTTGATSSGPVTTTTGYDGDGNQTSAVSANGNTTTMGYDHLGRQVSTTLPRVTLYDGSSTTPVETTGYDGDGNVVRTTDDTGATTTSVYDSLGRQVATTNPVSGTATTTYNATEATASQDMAGNVTTSTYDGAGRLVQASDALTGTTRYGYDAAGNTVAITAGDTAGNVTQLDTRQYDALNRVITDTVGGGPGSPSPRLTTGTRYDQDGNVAQTQQPNGDVTYNTYDLADQLTTVEIDPAAVGKGGGGQLKYESYSYDRAGNATTRTDADNRSHTSTLDGDDQTTQSTDTTSAPGGLSVITTTLGYDPDGNTVSQVRQTQGPSGPVQTHTVTSTYNAADWETSTSDDGLATSYGYDAAGQQRSHTILNGNTPVTSMLDPEGRTTSIAENMGGTGPYTTTFGYNGNDLVTSAGLPGGVGEQATYDPNSRLTHVGATGPSTGSGATTLSSGYDYGYNAVGWTTGMTWTVNGAVTSTQVTHDAQGRVTGWSGQPHGPESWNYDGNGNILSTSEYMDGAYRTSVYTYSATLPNEQIQGHTDGLGVEYRGYDNNGDTTSITSTDAPTKPNGSPNPYHVDMRLGYDSQARPVTVTTLQGGVPLTVTMAYNTAGQRARYTVAMSGTATVDERFGYRDGALAQMAAMTATLNGDGSVKSTGSYTDTYLYTADGQPLELLRQQGGGTKRYWYVLDGRGNVVAVTDSTGVVVDRYAYDPWGEGLPEGTNESIPQPFRYAGYWWDKELGWYWVSVRSYDPEGRWIQPDPSQQDGVRTYVYVGDDPIDKTDPTGLDESGVAGINTGNGIIDFIIIGAAAVGGTVVAVAASPEVLVGAGVYVTGAVVIGGVTYVVTRIHYGPTRTVTIPAYIPRPGDVQSTPIVGGTTATIPGQIPIPNIMHVKGEYVPSGLTKSERNKYREAVHIYKDDFDLPAPYVTPRHILDQIANAIKEGANPYDAAGEADAPPEGKQ